MPRKKKISSVASNTRRAYVIGHVDYVTPAYAYVVPLEEGQKDVWVKREALLGALHNDLVKVAVRRRASTASRRAVGRVVAIVKRNKALIVGRLVCRGKLCFVEPNGKRMHHAIAIERGGRRGARHGDKVVVKVIPTLTEAQEPMGVVQEVLGQAGVHEVELHAIAAEFGLPMRFPKGVLAEAEALELSLDTLGRRRDFREVLTLTIDPVDAQDFDDALSWRKLPNGHHEVGVHIADVSHYVREGSLLDEEALARGASVYLVDRTVPMLPEVLSNGLCSLRPREDKLTFSAVFELDAQGKVHREWLGETVICSDKRFAYEEAQEVLMGREGPFYTMLTVLNDLAKQLRAGRLQRGAVSFETTEVKFELDAQGKPLRLVPKVRQDPHRLVEEFMLLANQRVAEYVFRMQPGKHSPTFVYRTHDEPDVAKLNDFWAFAKQLGYPTIAPRQSVPQALNRLVDVVQGQAVGDVVQSLAIRTMAKALYTTEPKGHFGLAFAHYTHFTSPIRRYPDVMVHRLLKGYLRGGVQADARAYEKKCQHASAREQVAVDAERASMRYMQVVWMQGLQGDVLDGVISGLTMWGMYVVLVDSGCEGMVPLATMTDDLYVLDDSGLRVVGRDAKQVYQMGDSVRVVVRECDLLRRTVTLGLRA